MRSDTTTTETPPRTSPWQQMTPQERWRTRIPATELAMIDHAGELTERFELATTMLGLACDLLANVTGKTRAEVLDVLYTVAA